MKKNRKFIQEKFSQDGLHAPESLSEERVQEMLPLQEAMSSEESERSGFGEISTTLRKRRRGRRTIWRGAAAVAACLLVAVMVFPAAHERLLGEPEDPVLMEGDGFYTFQSYQEIRRLVDTLERNNQYGSWDTGGLFFRDEDAVMIEDAEAPLMAADSEDATADSAAAGAGGSQESIAAKSTADDSAQTGHSSTYLQVQDVDEADILKTDGEYLYYVNQNDEVLIYSAEEGQTKKVAEIGNDQAEHYFYDLYLKENLLVTVGVVYENGERSSAVVTYDISDRSSPEKVGEFRQSGEIVSSRMGGNYVYLVTSEYADSRRHSVPWVTQDGVFRKMELSDLCSVPEPKSPSYIILSSVDITSGERVQCKSKAIFGASEDIYCNNENLYMAASEYNENTGSTDTRIVRASLDGAKIGFEATGTVNGTILGQFSMDEKDGCFRVATTSRREGMEVNNLYTLDADLKEMGRLTGFARNESIRAVRYIGEKAYVITFRQVDPLFVIDLSDPMHPAIEGEVEIDGFSSLLVPVEGDRLLGIGYLTKDNGYGGVYKDGLKLALFDVSDPAHLVVLDSREFSGISSPAQATHLALTVNEKDGYFAIPYTCDSSDEAVWIAEDQVAAAEGEDGAIPEDSGTGDTLNSGILVFDVNEGIEVLDAHALSRSSLQRGAYIGDWIYALDLRGDVYSFAFDRQRR